MTTINENTLDISENELLNELKTEYSIGERLPGDVSAADMARVTGLTENWCCEILRLKYKSGKLLRFRVMGENNQSIWVYRKPIVAIE